MNEINERKQRLTAEYRGLLQTEEDRQVFDQNLGLARTVATFIEDHAFIIHDWYHSVEWNKVREFGRFLANNRFIDEVDDLFYLNRWEVPQALFEAVSAWSSVTPCRGANGYWKGHVQKRKGIIEALRKWTPPPALGPVPPESDDPVMLMLYGLNTERIQSWQVQLTGPMGRAADRPEWILEPWRVVEVIDTLAEIQLDADAPRFDRGMKFRHVV